MSFDNLKFMCGAKYKEYIFASCFQFNGLFKINCETGEREFVGSFPQESLACENLHRNAFVIDQNVIFVPYKAKNIHIYDIGKNEFYVIELNRGNYVNGYIGEKIDENIYLIPEMAGGDIIEFDYGKKRAEVVISWKEFEHSLETKIKSGVAFYRICAIDKSLFLPLCNTNFIFEICISTKKLFVHVLKSVNVWGCFKGQKDIWVLANKGNEIYSWNKEKNMIKKINCEILDPVNKRNINWIVDIGECVYALPAWGKFIWEVKNDQLVKLESFETRPIVLQTFYEPIEEEKILYLLPLGENNLLKIQDKCIKQIEIQRLDEKSKLYGDIIEANRDTAQNEIWIENIKFSLEQYVGLLL